MKKAWADSRSIYVLIEILDYENVEEGHKNILKYFKDNKQDFFGHDYQLNYFTKIKITDLGYFNFKDKAALMENYGLETEEELNDEWDLTHGYSFIKIDFDMNSQGFDEYYEDEDKANMQQRFENEFGTTKKHFAKVFKQLVTCFVDPSFSDDEGFRGMEECRTEYFEELYPGLSPYAFRDIYDATKFTMEDLINEKLEQNFIYHKAN